MTQSWVNPYLGIDGLKLLEEGSAAQQALDTLMNADPGKDVRQLGIVDAAGRSAAWSGRQCTHWLDTLPDLTSRCRETCWSASGQFRRWRKPSRAPWASRFPSALWPCSKVASLLEATSGPAVGGYAGVQDGGISLPQSAGGRAPPPCFGIASGLRSGASPIAALRRRNAFPEKSDGRSSENGDGHADDAPSLQAGRRRIRVIEVQSRA